MKDTIELMTSSDYKDRFKAEYWQTKIRYEKLREIIVRHKADQLAFSMNTPMNVLREQADSMNMYLLMLEVRAKIENIKL